MTPVFVTLYVLTIPDGVWRVVLGVHVFVTIVIALGALAFLKVGIWVGAEGLRERGYFGRTAHFPIVDIGSTILAQTFSGGGTESLPQLFVRGHDGRTLVRMRGEFWSKETIDVVVATLDVPHETLNDAVSREELRSNYPDLLYWFEERPVVAALAFTAATAVLGALVVVALNVLGVSTN
ncbi:MAG: hypothetical protein ABJA94_06500 [Rhodoglobus sp.]